MKEKKRKAIRVQIEILYTVPEEFAQDIYNQDLNVLHEIKRGYESWKGNPDEIRDLIDFDLQTDIIPIIDDQEFGGQNRIVAY